MFANLEFPFLVIPLVTLAIWLAARPQRSKAVSRANVNPAKLEALRYIHIPVRHEGQNVDLLFTPSEFDAGVARARRQPEDLSNP